MTVLSAVLWGALQGISEFLPISSSGHLVIIPRYLGLEAPSLVFDIYLHFGTLLAVVILFRKDIFTLFGSQRKLGGMVLLGSLPVLAVGILFADKIEFFFTNPGIVGWLLVINGFVLFAGHIKLQTMKSYKIYSPLNSLIVGIAQTLALLPGISRSGITITAGILNGLERKDAYKLSFLLFVPASLMALFYSFGKISSVKEIFNPSMLAGTIISAIVGIFGLKILYSVLLKTKLYILAIYCVIIGTATVILF